MAMPERDSTVRSDLSALRIDRDADLHVAAPRPRRRLRWAIAIVAALVLVAAMARMRSARAVVVQVAPAVARGAGEPVSGPVLSGTGYVVTGEKYISIGVRVAGKIERYFVEEGQSVHVGDPLVALEDRDYRARLERAEAALEVMRANLALHESELRRARSLFGSGVVARQDLDERLNRVAVDRASIAQLTAEITQAKVELDYTVLHAPRDGVILAKLKEVGEIAVPGGFAGSGDLIRMANLDDMRAEVDVNESDLQRVQMGQAAEVLPDAYPDRSYPAHVVKLYPQVNRQKGTLKIEVKIPAPDERLLPDMSVRVNFLAEARPTGAGAAVVLAPRTALRRDGAATYVWQVENGHARRTAVTVGTELGDQVQIASGLAGGESLVVGDAAALSDGAPVEIAKASP